MAETEFYIYDTGSLTKDGTGTPVAITNRAGYDGSIGVSQFKLYITNMTYNGSGEVLANTELRNTDELSDISQTSFKNPSFSINAEISKDQIPSTGFQYSWFYQLTRLERTKGLKIIYMTQDDAGWENLIQQYGQFYKSTITAWNGDMGGSKSFIMGVVKNIANVTDNPSVDKLRFQITFTLA